jgi:glycine/D-amino acid oxidase-like deaminating enzyme
MKTITTDVLIIGAGAAGIRAAPAASERGVDVILIAKSPVTESGSTFSPVSRGWAKPGVYPVHAGVKILGYPAVFAAFPVGSRRCA